MTVGQTFMAHVLATGSIFNRVGPTFYPIGRYPLREYITIFIIKNVGMLIIGSIEIIFYVIE